jgi:MFS transporter, DHA1 family, inner membrane transport protein
LNTTATSFQSTVAPASSVLLAAGSLGLLATVIAAVLPVLVGAWQSELGVAADEAGYVAAAELFAQVAGTLLFLRVDRALGWRRCAAAGLVLMIVGNLGSAASSPLPALLASRLVAGTGGGAVRALAMNLLARASNPGRAFAIYASGQVALAASLTAAMPATLSSIGLKVVFGVLAVACVLGLRLVSALPAQSGDETHIQGTRRWARAALLTLAGLFVYFVGQAAVWTYLAPLGSAEGISPKAVAATLTTINVAGLAGTLTAGLFAGRVRALSGVTALLVLTLGSVIMLFHAHVGSIFGIAACMFYFAWCLSLPLQFTLIAASDVSGRAGAAAPAVDGLGLACGAAAGGALLAHFGLAATGVLCAIGSILGIGAYAVAGRLAHEPKRCL